MISYPNAKINLGLNIINKRDDGYHNIESVFYPIPLFDILEINASNIFHFTSSGLAIGGDPSDNLVVKAYEIIKAKFSIPAVKIHLHKQIPMGAGLGGGSSNAAYVILMLNDLFNLNLSEIELINLASKLGSDCAFFINNEPQYITGTGNVLKNIDLNLNGYYLKIINPEIHISTQKAYSEILSVTSDQNLIELVQSPIDQWKSVLKNDFEKSIFSNYAILEKIKKKLYQDGASYVSMTGSGSSIFGIYKEKPNYNFPDNYERILNL